MFCTIAIAPVVLARRSILQPLPPGDRAFGHGNSPDCAERTARQQEKAAPNHALFAIMAFLRVKLDRESVSELPSGSYFSAQPRSG